MQLYLLPSLQIFVLHDYHVDDFWFYNKFNRSLFVFKYFIDKPICTEYRINILLRLYFMHLYLIKVSVNDLLHVWLFKFTLNALQVHIVHTSTHRDIIRLFIYSYLINNYELWGLTFIACRQHKTFLFLYQRIYRKIEWRSSSFFVLNI